jgi:hypothetical protein
MKHLSLSLALLIAAFPVADDDDAPWGEEARGFRARAVAEGDSFARGEPVLVRFALRNVSDEPQTVWRRGFWPNHRVDVTGSDGEPVALTPLGEQKRKAFLDDGPVEKSAPHTIEPGETDDGYEPYDLAELFALDTPGEYTVAMIYQESADSPPVESNALPFEVRK